LNAAPLGYRTLTLSAREGLLVVAPPQVIAETAGSFVVRSADSIRRDRAARTKTRRFVALAIVTASELPIATGEQKRRTLTADFE
jgi:hypothetical protein